MRMIFMGKDKSSTALEHLVNLGVEIVAVVAPSHNEQNLNGPKLCDIAGSFNLSVCSDIDIYQHLDGTKMMDLDLENIDMVISFLFWKRIKKPLINLARLGCINFHSAPLPEYRGWAVYNAAILNNEQHWGVSAHFVDTDFDTGDLIQVDRFDIDPKKETAFSLERRSHIALLELFDKIMNMVVKGESLPREYQERNAGITYTKQEILKYETINIDDLVENIDAKTRAFWYPPFAAKIVLNGKELFLVTSDIMKEIAAKYNKN